MLQYVILNIKHMETLTAIFGSHVKVRLLRLFLFNQETPFTLKELSQKTKSSSSAVRKEINVLLKVNVVKKRQVFKDIAKRVQGKTTLKKVGAPGYVLDNKFQYLESLKNLLTAVSLHADDTLVKRFQGIGKVRLFLASGVFIQNWDSRVDLLIVGDELNISKIESIIKNVEAEIGKEISFAAFETQDFEYRRGIHDRLIRDIMDYPHVTLVDKLGIEFK